MRLVSRFNAKAGFADLWDYVREPRPFKWTFLTISILIPLGATAMLANESHLRPPDPPKVVFINTLPEGRSDADIRASNIENQRRKEAVEAEREELRQKKVDAYKALGRATGLDVDTMAREAEVTNAREAAERKARQEELYQAGRTVDDTAE